MEVHSTMLFTNLYFWVVGHVLFIYYIITIAYRIDMKHFWCVGMVWMFTHCLRKIMYMLRPLLILFNYFFKKMTMPIEIIWLVVTLQLSNIQIFIVDQWDFSRPFIWTWVYLLKVLIIPGNWKSFYQHPL